MMKKSFYVLMMTLFFAGTSFKPAEEGKLVWLDFNKGYELARKKNKIMLVDVYTDWCGWCKRMDRDTYAKHEVIEVINSDFVAIKFNPEIPNMVYTFEGKTYSGKELEQVISNSQISGYPTTIFMYPKDKKMNVVGGYHNADSFKGILASVKSEFKSATVKKK